MAKTVVINSKDCADKSIDDLMYRARLKFLKENQGVRATDSVVVASALENYVGGDVSE